MAGETPDFVNTGTDSGVPAPPEQGQAQLPNGGSIDTTQGLSSGDPESAAANTPTQQPPVNAQVQPQQLQQAPPGAMQAPPPPQLPPPPKGVDPNNPNAYHPSVQKAGLFHTIAEALAGGPRFDVKINPNTGETERTRLPMSTGQILGAIALEAVSGSAAGLSVKNGPGNLGRAAGAGFQQVAQQEQQAKQEQLNQATTDYARHAQILETNMRMWQNAQTVGRQDLQEHKDYVGQFADLANRVQTEFPGIVKARVPESQLSQYHVTKDGAIPVGVAPRPDPNEADGQARGEFGQKLWDNEYLVIDPSFKAEGLLTDADKADAAKYHLQGFVDGKGNPIKLPDNVTLGLGMVLNYKSQIASIKALEGEIGSYWDTVNSPQAGTPTNVPAVKDAQIQGLADKYADLYNVPKAYVRAIINQESGGDQKAVSPKGAIGAMQLMPATARQMGVDPTDLEDNIKGGVRYFSQLLDQFKDPKLALAAYNAGPDRVQNGQVPNIPETQNYVKSISNALGLDNQPAPSDSTPKIDMAKAIAADPTLPSALSKAQSFINAAGGNVPKGLQAYSQADSAGAAKVLPLFGGSKTLERYTDNKALNLEQQKENIKNGGELNRQALDRQAKEQEKAADYADVAKDIAGDPDDPGSGDLTALDKLISQRTADRPKVYAAIKKINPNWNPTIAEAKLNTWKDFIGDGKGAQQITSFNAFMQHVGQGIDVNNRYRRLNSPLLNKSWNWLETNAANNPQVKEFLAAEAPVKSEYLRLLSNNQALHQADKEEGERLVSVNDTPAGFEQAMKTMAATAAVRIKANNSKWTRVFGNGHNVPGMIDPDTIASIQKLTDPHGNNEVASILKDMDVGGTITGSADGRGVPGNRLGDLVKTGTSQGQYQFTTKDGKMGWNGTQWVPIGQ